MVWAMHEEQAPLKYSYKVDSSFLQSSSSRMGFAIHIHFNDLTVEVAFDMAEHCRLLVFPFPAGVEKILCRCVIFQRQFGSNIFRRC